LRTLEHWPELHVIVCGRRAAYVRADADHEAVALTRRYCHRLDFVRSFDDLTDDVVKIALICPPERTDRMLAHPAAELPADTVVPTSSGHGSIDLIARGVNKGTALAWLGQHLDTSTEAMIAFGDGGSDLEMLRTVGHGVAMAQAPDMVRAHARAITTSNNDAGVLTYLEQALPVWQCHAPSAANPGSDPTHRILISFTLARRQ
jgi:hydroxymethylpyrimidine pyrophosphatase-like HAD family hydrolase